MNTSCKNICNRYNTLHSNNQGSGYHLGLSWCSMCSKWFEEQNIFISPGNRKLCPCCKTPVRTKPKYKSKILIKVRN